MPEVKLVVTIDGHEAMGLFSGDMVLMCGETERPLVLSALAEAMVLVCGTRPRDDVKVDISVRRAAPAPVFSIVNGEKT